MMMFEREEMMNAPRPDGEHHMKEGKRPPLKRPHHLR
jgi:hypothetical protein